MGVNWHDYIRMHPDFMDSWIWNDHLDYLLIWTRLMFECAHDPFVTQNGELLQNGEAIINVRSLASKSNSDVETVDKFLRKMRRTKLAKIKKIRGAYKITLLPQEGIYE